MKVIKLKTDQFSTTCKIVDCSKLNIIPIWFLDEQVRNEILKLSPEMVNVSYEWDGNIMILFILDVNTKSYIDYPYKKLYVTFEESK
jgi:hypothetical protein